MGQLTILDVWRASGRRAGTGPRVVVRCVRCGEPGAAILVNLGVFACPTCGVMLSAAGLAVELGIDLEVVHRKGGAR